LQWLLHAVALANATACIGLRTLMANLGNMAGKMKIACLAKDQNQLDTIYNKPKRKKDCSGGNNPF
jgi:hypothetical protein